MTKRVEEKVKLAKKQWFLFVIALLIISMIISVCGQALADPTPDLSVNPENLEENSAEEAYRRFLEYRYIFTEEFEGKYKDGLIKIAQAAGEETVHAYKHLPKDLMETYTAELVEIAKASGPGIPLAYQYIQWNNNQLISLELAEKFKEIVLAFKNQPPINSYGSYSYGYSYDADYYQAVRALWRFFPKELVDDYIDELVEIAKASGRRTARAYECLPRDLMKTHAVELVEIAKAAGKRTSWAYQSLPLDLMETNASELVEIAQAAGEETGYAYRCLPKELMETYAGELVEIAKAAKESTGPAYKYLSLLGLTETRASELVEIAKAVGLGTPLAYQHIQWNNNQLISLELAEKFREIALASGEGSRYYRSLWWWDSFPNELVANYMDELVEIAKAAGETAVYAYRYLPKELMETYAGELVEIAKAAKDNTDLAYEHLPKDLMKTHASELVEIARAVGRDISFTFRHLPKDLMKTHTAELVEIAKAAGPGTPLAYRCIQQNNNQLISLELAEKFEEIVLASDHSYLWTLWENFPYELAATHMDELVEIAKVLGKEAPSDYRYLPKDLMKTQAAELVEITRAAKEGTSLVYQYIQWNNNQLISLELAGKFREIALISGGHYYGWYSLWSVLPKKLVADHMDELVEIARVAGKNTSLVYQYLPGDLMESNAQELVEITRVAEEGAILAYQYIQWNNNQLISLELANKFREIISASGGKGRGYLWYGLWNYFPKELVATHIDELVEIAKAAGKETSHAYESLPIDLMEVCPQELVEIAKTAKEKTHLAYAFVRASGVLLTAQQAQEFVRVRAALRESSYYDPNNSAPRYRKFIEKIEDPQMKKLAGFLDYDLWNFKQDFLRAKILLLIEKVAPQKVDFISSFLRGRDEYYYSRHHDYEEIKQVTETAETLIQLLPHKELNNHQKEYLFSRVSDILYGLARTVDYLHDRVRVREKVASNFSPEICYFIIGGPEEIYTSSFNLLFDNLAFRLAGGEGLLPQEREERTQAQNQRVDLGERKIVDHLERIDPERTHFFRFITKTSYYGRLYRIIPGAKSAQKEFLKKIFSLMEAKERLTRNVFYLSPTFEDIFTQEISLDLRETLEELLLESFGSSQGRNKKVYGLLILRYLQYFSHSSRAEAESIVEKVRKECGIKQKDFSQVPVQWLEPCADEKGPTIKIKLYFENEGLVKEGRRPIHYSIFKNLFTNRKLNTNKPGKAKIIGGYEASVLDNNEILLTKRIDNVEVKIILSMAEKRKDINRDWQDPTIDIIVHRGHSFQVKEFFWVLGRTKINWPKGVFLGSCGGFNAIPGLDRTLSYQAQFIASKGEGRGIVNNVIIYFLVEALAKGMRDWSEIKAYIFEEIEKNLSQIKKDISQNIAPYQARKFTLRRLRSYSFPADLPMLILRYVG